MQKCFPKECDQLPNNLLFYCPVGTLGYIRLDLEVWKA